MHKPGAGAHRQRRRADSPQRAQHRSERPKPGGNSPERPEKRDDPRQGGEEARVVVHQPRGVGLIHPRLRPSNAYYTHDSRQ
ncbi:hypothetical protein CEG92_02205 [Mycobacterium avium subsp. paratuberculosis]|nr:hypothetical protein CEG92_02205 [Mycobacterium avium subsp. paratuberculosis]